MLLGQFSIPTSSRVTLWRAPLLREESMQTRRKGLISLLVALETGSIPLSRQCNTEGKSSEGHHKDNLFLPPPTSAWLCCCCLPSSFFSALPDSHPLFSSAQVPLLFLVGLSSPCFFSLTSSFLFLFLLISPHFPG